MVTIKPIKSGEQIVRAPLASNSEFALYWLQFNTYGDPPNSELLRRCGHVDYIPLPAEVWGDHAFGNPGDTAELTADRVVKVALRIRGRNEKQADMLERIDWWLEEGGDEYVCYIS